MSRADRVREELEEVRGGATLLILLDCLQAGRCSEDEQKTERENYELLPETQTPRGTPTSDQSSTGPVQSWTMDQIKEEELSLLNSPGQLISDLIVQDHTGSTALNLRSNTDLRSDHTTLHQHYCLLEHNRTVLHCPLDAPWTRLVLIHWDIPTTIRGNGQNLTPHPRALRMDHSNNVIISCAGLFQENTDFHFGSHDNPQTDPNNNPDVQQCDTGTGENLNLQSQRGLLKPPENLCGPGESSGRDKKIRKKSVSFDDDVLVFLFDQESPTEDLASGTNKPPSTHEVHPGDNGLEWEDDFSALEDSFQHVSLSQRHIRTLPTQIRTTPTRPQRYLLSQNHLFLTHVNESDLEI